ncbi:MAG: alpha-rhamnosidase [Prevotella sp.]|nr:alpha-rhamnosidase [Prevotella sp.]
MVSKATWIWYPGDYEIWLGNKMNNRRTDRGAYFPPFWKQDSHYVTVEFSKVVNLVEEETVTLATEGNYNIKIDGKMLFGMPKEFSLSAGVHHINIKVHNQCSPPTLFILGKTINSDESWNVTFEDKEWIDESGKASDTLSTVYRHVGFWNFNSPDDLPSNFKLKRRHDNVVSCIDGLFDFGRETFGYVKLHGIKGEGKINLYYGESEEEAKDKEFCETLDKLVVKDGVITDLVTGNTVSLTDVYTMENSKTFRYVFVDTEGCSIENVSMDYEYMPEQEKGSFKCSDEEVNRIWDIGVYTLQLTAREFFIDGIKRDRWVWSGDATQSYLMNFYLFNDNEMVKRTTWLLGGKVPVTSHINTIMDYTFYWLISIYDYYLYSGDRHFLFQIYPMMQVYMDFVLGRTDRDGMVEGMTGDWVFVDWADEPMDKHGQLAFEQILFKKSLEAISAVAEITGDSEGCEKYGKLADVLGAKLIPYFWNDNKQALIHNRINGKQGDSLFRYPNIFAVLYGYLTKEQQESVKRTVILNDDVLKITTPYMRFYELEALCILGEQNRVMKEIKSYWGGMLMEGATTFWEKYNPDEHGVKKYAMYGRPYGKSLCHAWGASPIYLLGKYFLGVKPTKPGYEEYKVSPALGGLDWIEGKVPTPFGSVYVKMTKESVTVMSDGGKGTLVLNGGKKQVDIPVGSEITVML